MEETLICYKDNENYYCKLIKGFFAQRDIADIFEFVDVVKYINLIDNQELTQFQNLEDIRCFYLTGRKQIETYLFQDHTWFHGIFNDKTVELRRENAEEELHFEYPIANFFGWKISEKSSFARNSDIQIFKNSKKISNNIIEELKNSKIIETENIWGKSITNHLIHLIISDFNKKTDGLAIASYFEIWKWNKENLIFESFDPESPSRDDNFNSKECLVFEDELVFEFYKPAYLDNEWNVFQASIESEYLEVINIGEPFDSAFYTITALNNLIKFLKTKPNRNIIFPNGEKYEGSIVENDLMKRFVELELRSTEYYIEEHGLDPLSEDEILEFKKLEKFFNKEKKPKRNIIFPNIEKN